MDCALAARFDGACWERRMLNNASTSLHTKLRHAFGPSPVYPASPPAAGNLDAVKPSLSRLKLKHDHR